MSLWAPLLTLVYLHAATTVGDVRLLVLALYHAFGMMALLSQCDVAASLSSRPCAGLSTVSHLTWLTALFL